MTQHEGPSEREQSVVFRGNRFGVSCGQNIHLVLSYVKLKDGQLLLASPKAALVRTLEKGLALGKITAIQSYLS